MDIGRIERIVDIRPASLPLPEVLPEPEPSRLGVPPDVVPVRELARA
jgi:hypothetical protein